MGAVDTTYTFTATDTITSTKMNNIIDQTTITTDAIIGTTLDVASGKLKIRSAGITSNEMGANSVVTAAITDANVTTAKIADANVTETKLATGIRIPSGAIMPFAMNSAPTGWLAADGASVSTSTYAALFAAIGYTYGGTGGSFNLPDLRGIFVRGSGSQVISGGTFSGTFAQKQAHMFQDHGHAGYTDAQGNHAHRYDLADDNGSGAVGGGSYGTSGNSGWNYWTETTGLHSHNIQTYGANSGTAGGETRPANIALLYCIKL